MRRETAWGVVMVFVAGCGSGGVCSAGELEAALAAASAGDVVLVGECRVEGSFEVPADVTLRGAGVGRSVIAGDGSLPAVRLRPGASATRLELLTIEAAGPLGVVARGAGAATIADVDVDLASGYGIGAEDLDAVTLERVTVRGAITEDNAASFAAEDARVGSRGVVLIDVALATIDDVRVSGVAESGIAASGSDLVITGGDLSGNRTNALVVRGGHATITGLRACGTIRVLLASALAFADGAEVETTDVVVCGSGGTGIAQQGGIAIHHGLVIEDNQDVGAWIAGAVRVELDGASLRGNGVTGLIVTDAADVSLVRVTASGSVLRDHLVTPSRAIRSGDGIELSRSSDTAPPLRAVLRDVELVANPRVGLVIHGAGGALDGVVIESVIATAEDAALGVVAQHVAEPRPGAWDARVAREGAAVANDPAFVDALDLVGITMPPIVPPTPSAM